MLFFHKNKRKFAYRSHRRVFVAMFLLMIVSTIITSLILKASAADGPIPSIEFVSENSNFADNEGGSWKVRKTVDWVDAGKARITFEINSKAFINENAVRDIVLVLDVSGSMEGEKIRRITNDATELVSNLLDSPENQIALITFSDEANVLSEFSRDESALLTDIGKMHASGGTNYYAALKEVENILSDYDRPEGHELAVLFLTDGFPNAETPNEVAQYHILKNMFPDVSIHGIQYEMGETMAQQLIDVSDRQYIASMDNLYNILFEAAITSEVYSNFTVTDYIDDTYWTVADSNAAVTDFGSAEITYNGSTPIVTWDLGENGFRSGDSATMTIDIDLKDGYLGNPDLLLPTNRREIIETSIRNVPDENIDSNLTPILMEFHLVEYDANSPSDCTPSGTIPDAQKHSVFSAVEKSDNKLSCSGYRFDGWQFETTGITHINDDYFRMPNSDVTLKAIWSKPTISKTVEGEPNVRAGATFDKGETVWTKMRTLAGDTTIDVHSSQLTIKHIVRADTIPGTININDSKYILSAADSPVKIYGWYDSNTIYYYSDADDIYLNDDASFMFFGFEVLESIDFLRDWHTENTTIMNDMFGSDHFTFTSFDALANWDVSNVEDMGGTFSINVGTYDIGALANWNVSKVENMKDMFSGGYTIVNMDALSEWDTGSVTDMSYMFAYHPQLDPSALSGWDTSNVVNMEGMFMSGPVDSWTNLDAFSEWDTSNVENMSWMFYSANGDQYENRPADYGVYNINGLSNWNVGKVKTLAGFLSGNNHLADISGLSNWRPHSLENMSYMIEYGKYTNVDALANWDVSTVTNMAYLFFDTDNLQNVDGLSEWNTSNVQYFSGMFSLATALSDISGMSEWNTGNAISFYNMFNGATQLKNIDALSDWDVRKVESMAYMFYGAGITNMDGAENWVTTSLKQMNGMFAYSDIENIGHIDEVTGEPVGGMSKWDTSNVTYMNNMFSYAGKLKTIAGVTNWETGNVISMNSMFDDTTQLTSIDPLAGWDVRNVKDMGWMFDTVSKVTSISALSQWQTDSLETISNTFSSMSRLQSLDGLQNWDTSKVTNMYCAFDHTVNLHSMDELANWDVSKATNMANMFANSRLTNVNGMANWHPNSATRIENILKDNTMLTDISGLSGWFSTDETSKVVNMEYLLKNTRITNLNALSGWKTPNLTNMRYAFSEIPTLSNVDGLENWNTAKVTTVEGFFSGDTGITATNAFEKLNSWNTTKLTNKTDAFKDVPEEVLRPTWN